MMAIFYKTILRLNYLKSLNKIELPVQLPPEVPPPPGLLSSSSEQDTPNTLITPNKKIRLNSCFIVLLFKIRLF